MKRGEIFKHRFSGELVRFLRHIKKAGQFGDLPPTGMGAAIAQGTNIMPAGVVTGGLASGMDLATTGGLATASLFAPIIYGRLMAAAATGQPGALGKAMAEMGEFMEPVGRLAGGAAPTDE